MTHYKLDAGRVLAQEKCPYLSAALWRLRFREIPAAEWPISAGEIAVRPDGLVLVKEGWPDKWSLPQIAAGINHECMHVLMDHAGRQGSRDQQVFNIANDVAINPDVLDTWGELPVEKPCTPELFGFERGLSSEAYYELLLQNAKTVHVCCGSGAGNRHPVEDQVAGSEPVEIEASEWQVTRIAVAQAVREHAKSRGRLPAGLERWAEETLEPSPVDWRRVLAGAARSELKAAGAWDYTYRHPSRRRVPGVVLPSLRAPRLKAGVVVDTSGSRSETDLAGDLADVKGILKLIGAEVEVVSCDAAVGGRGKVRSVKDAAKLLKGGGGTDMGPGIAEAVKGRPDIVIVMSDGQVGGDEGWGPRPGRVKVVAIVPPGAPEAPSWVRRVERTAT